MEDTDKSFATKYGFNKPTTNKVSPVVKKEQTVSALLCRRTYKVTETNDVQIKQLEKMIQAKLNKSVGQSSIIRGLIQLAASDTMVREQLMDLIDNETIHWGRPKNSQ